MIAIEDIQNQATQLQIHTDLLPFVLKQCLVKLLKDMLM